MSYVTQWDVRNFLRNYELTDILHRAGFDYADGKYIGMHTVQCVDHKAMNGMGKVSYQQSRLEIPNFQIAKELDLQLSRVGVKVPFVHLDPKGAYCQISVAGLTPGDPVPKGVQELMMSLTRLINGSSLSHKIEVVLAESKDARHNSRKAEALQRYLARAFEEARKLKL